MAYTIYRDTATLHTLSARIFDALLLVLYAVRCEDMSEFLLPLVSSDFMFHDHAFWFKSNYSRKSYQKKKVSESVNMTAAHIHKQSMQYGPISIVRYQQHSRDKKHSALSKIGTI